MNKIETYGVIYKITNLKNGKVYIGQSVDVEERFRHHKQTAYRNNDKNKNRPLYRAIRKYGLDNFYFEIIDFCNNKNDMDKKEREYIECYKSNNREFGYNIENGGNSIGKHSEETKRKISESQKGELNHMYGKPSPKRKKIINYTTGKIYCSLSECAIKEYGDIKYIKNIQRVCDPKSNRKTYKGNIYYYLDENNNPILKQYKFKESGIKIIDELSGIIFNSINECANYFNISPNKVRYRINGIVKPNLKEGFILKLYTDYPNKTLLLW